MTSATTTHSTPPGSTWRRGRRWWPWVGAVLTLVTAWLSTPAWGPFVAARFVPEGWRLGEVYLAVPGPRSGDVAYLEAEGALPGLRVALRVTDATLHYFGPVLHAGRLEVVLAPAGGRPDALAPPAGPASWSLPVLALPADLPAMTLGEMVIRLGDEAGAPSWTFRDLALGGQASNLSLTARLEAPDAVALPLRLNVEADSQRLAITIENSAGADDGRPSRSVIPNTGLPALRLAYVQTARADGMTDATFELRFDLDSLAPGALDGVFAALGLRAPEALSGRLDGSARLAGEDRLEPRSLNLDVADATVSLPGTTLDAELLIMAERVGDSFDFEMQRAAFVVDGALPELDGLLETFWSGLGLRDPPRAEDVSVRFRLPASEQAPMTGRLSAAEPRALAARGALALEIAQQDGFSLALDLDDLVVDVPRLARPGELTLDAAVAFRGQVQRPLAFDVDTAMLGLSAAAIDLHGRLAYTPARTVEFEGQVERATLQDPSLGDPTFTARVGAFGASGTLSLQGERIRFQGPVSGTALVVAPTDAIAASSLLVADSVQFDLTARQDDALRIDGAGQLAGARLPDLDMSAALIDLTIDTLELPPGNGRLGIATTGFQAVVDGTIRDGVDFDIDGNLESGQRFTGAGEALLGLSASLPFELGLDLDSAALDVRFSSAVLPATALPAAARPLTVALPDKLRFEGGQLVIDGGVRLDTAGMNGALDVTGERLALGFGESRVDGLEFRTRIDLDDDVIGAGNLALELAELAAGLDVRALGTDIEFRNADLGLVSLSAELLGGALSTPALRLSGGELLGTVIRWEGFDLGRLLRFVDVTGLDGVGTVDATFPVEPDDDGPSVRGGRFAARGPGQLRYSAGVPATNIGMQALENFQYDSLEGTVDYDSAGDYTISLDLLGRNPDLYGGHPIRFRLNLGGEMPAMFRSLFLTGDFEQGIIERLRAGEAPLGEIPESEP